MDVKKMSDPYDVLEHLRNKPKKQWECDKGAAKLERLKELGHGVKKEFLAECVCDVCAEVRREREEEKKRREREKK